MGLITLIIQINYSKYPSDYLRGDHQKFIYEKFKLVTKLGLIVLMINLQIF